jgi:hypothetical protein
MRRVWSSLVTPPYSECAGSLGRVNGWEQEIIVNGGCLHPARYRGSTLFFECLTWFSLFRMQRVSWWKRPFCTVSKLKVPTLLCLNKTETAAIVGALRHKPWILLLLWHISKISQSKHTEQTYPAHGLGEADQHQEDRDWRALITSVKLLPWGPNVRGRTFERQVRSRKVKAKVDSH